MANSIEENTFKVLVLMLLIAIGAGVLGIFYLNAPKSPPLETPPSCLNETALNATIYYYYEQGVRDTNAQVQTIFEYTADTCEPLQIVVRKGIYNKTITLATPQCVIAALQNNQNANNNTLPPVRK